MINDLDLQFWLMSSFLKIIDKICFKIVLSFIKATFWNSLSRKRINSYELSGLNSFLHHFGTKSTFPDFQQKKWKHRIWIEQWLIKRAFQRRRKLFISHYNFCYFNFDIGFQAHFKNVILFFLEFEEQRRKYRKSQNFQNGKWRNGSDRWRNQTDRPEK